MRKQPTAHTGQTQSPIKQNIDPLKKKKISIDSILLVEPMSLFFLSPTKGLKRKTNPGLQHHWE